MKAESDLNAVQLLSVALSEYPVRVRVLEMFILFMFSCLMNFRFQTSTGLRRPLLPTCHMRPALQLYTTAQNQLQQQRADAICNVWHPDTLTLRVERQSARMSKITNDGLTRSGTGCFIGVPIWQQWASKGSVLCTSISLTLVRTYYG